MSRGSRNDAKNTHCSAAFKAAAAVIDVWVPEEENVIPMVPGGKRLDQMVLGSN